MGRALSNTMINLGIQGECDEAIYQVLYFMMILKTIVLAKQNTSFYLNHVFGWLSFFYFCQSFLKYPSLPGCFAGLCYCLHRSKMNKSIKISSKVNQ